MSRYGMDGRLGSVAQQSFRAREKKRGQKAEALEARKIAIAARREAERNELAEQAAEQARRDHALEVGDALGR